MGYSMYIESMPLEVHDPFQHDPLTRRMATKKRCLEFRFLKMRLYVFVEDIFARPGPKPPFMRALTIAYTNKADCMRKLLRIRLFLDVSTWSWGMPNFHDHLLLTKRGQ